MGIPSVPENTMIPGSVDSSIASDSAATAFRKALGQLTSPALEQRKSARRALQQTGYATVLYEVVQRDAPGALIMAVRSKARLDYALPSNTLYVTVPITGSGRQSGPLSVLTPPSSPPLRIPLVEDFIFPVDPWAP